MSDELKQTIRIKRARVETDDRGRTVWTGPVEETELELVSTVMLKKILDDDNNAATRAGLDAAAHGKDGVLARNVDTDKFEIVEEHELQGAEELSLVSTQALRRVLSKDDSDSAGTGTDAEDVDDTGPAGFDPYNSA